MEDWRALYLAQQAFDGRENLSRVAAPTLVIAGDADRLVSVEDANELAGGIPNARLLVLPAAGHLVNVEQPHRFQVAVREFLLS